MIDLSPIGTFLVTHFTIFFFFGGNLFVCMLKNLALLSFLYHKFVDMSMD